MNCGMKIPQYSTTAKI